jgi:UDP-N-acetylglucosamine 4-epimerase
VEAVSAVAASGDLERFLARRRRWLVTGSAGFIGSHLVEELLRRGQEVLGLDDFSSGTRANVAAAERAAGAVGSTGGRFTLVEGDAGDARLLRDVLPGVEVVLHQAARNSGPRSVEDPAAAFAVNARGFQRLLGVVAEFPGVRLVYASSSSVYGDSPRQPRREDELGNPLSPYAATKRIDEIAAAVHARVRGVSAVGLRYFNVFGPRQDPHGPYAAVIPRWIECLRDGRAPLVFGDGSTARDFTPVENVVRANLLAVCAGPAVSGRVYNVGLGRSTKLTELLAALRRALALRGVETAGIEPRHAPPRRGDAPDSRADLSRAHEELGYEPVGDLEAGIDRTLDDYLT